MILKNRIRETITAVLHDELGLKIDSLEIQETRKEFEGDYTLVVFPLVRQMKMKPEAAGEKIGELLLNEPEFTAYNVVKGFLNLSISEDLYREFLHYFSWERKSNDKTTMVEYSSPNTNKPLHLGHIRNNLLGNSVSRILNANGDHVIQTQIINDRGIHICKSMLAWQKWGNGETPESANMKGDHLVGKYYVEFDKHYRSEIRDLVAKGMSEDEAKKEAPLLLEAQEMLRQWEDGDMEVRSLWEKMNSWVYEGFNATYQRMDVHFDTVLYESETYVLGKDIVKQGLENGVFYQKEDGSVWINLTDEGLDEKLILRSDGTSVYITQDIGTAVKRHDDHSFNEMIYVVGNEQDYHFKVLFLILEKLGYDWAKNLEHLSYGMVDLPEGKMKSREGTVVDADDLMEEMHQTAKEIANEAGKLDDFSDEEKESIYETIGMGALKYYILKVDPKKRILFDPKESVDFNGNTGPFIQYTYVRIQSILRKAGDYTFENLAYDFNPVEKEILQHLSDFEETLQKAADELSPAHMANYVYDLVKLFNSFYQNYSILNAEEEEAKNARLLLAKKVGETVKIALDLLGIKVPARM